MRFVRCFWGRLDRAYFLGTNSNTAQGRPGNLYLDEYFWISGFKKLRRAASGMASQTRYRSTYFSTPSSMAHEAYFFYCLSSGAKALI